MQCCLDDGGGLRFSLVISWILLREFLFVLVLIVLVLCGCVTLVAVCCFCVFDFVYFRL